MPVAVHLQSQIESARLHLHQKWRNRLYRIWTLGKPRISGELYELVKIVMESRNELARPRQADQRDASRRKRGPQSSPCRDGTEQVAKLECSQDGNLHHWTRISSNPRDAVLSILSLDRTSCY